jgi:hypothetical protein
LFLVAGECFFYWLQNRTLWVAEFPLAQFMVTIANQSLLNDLQSQREQDLAEARAIQMGMLPQGALRNR